MIQKNVLVTGATGFIGMELVKRLLNSGVNVVAIVRNPDKIKNLYFPNLKVLKGDLDNINDWSKFIPEAEYDVFYHIAWKGVEKQQRNDEIQILNIQHSIDTLKIAKKVGCKTWIGIGSQAEYGLPNRKISEEDLPAPKTLYGAAKLSTCMLTGNLGELLGINTLWIRLFSVYGPGDANNTMITSVIDSLLAGKCPPLTSGEQLWDYLFIDDAINAILHLVTNNTKGIYNIGFGESFKIKEIIELIRDTINPEIQLRFGEILYNPNSIMHLEADINKIKKDTGWKPEVGLTDGITKTVNFHRSKIYNQ